MLMPAFPSWSISARLRARLTFSGATEVGMRNWSLGLRRISRPAARPDWRTTVSRSSGDGPPGSSTRSRSASGTVSRTERARSAALTPSWADSFSTLVRNAVLQGTVQATFDSGFLHQATSGSRVGTKSENKLHRYLPQSLRAPAVDNLVHADHKLLILLI
jgi:hypothetical protein